MKVLMMIMIAISVCIIYDVRKIINKNFPNHSNSRIVGMVRVVALMISLICSGIYYFI